MEENKQAGIWSAKEFGKAELGDMRRTKRLVSIGAGLMEEPGRAISTACGRTGAQSISRFFDCDEVSVDGVLGPHREQIRERCKDEDRILAIQDTTCLDFGNRSSVEGLGPITGTGQSRGLLMQGVLILSEGKTPLGVAGLEIWARDEAERGKAKDRRKRKVSQKESQKWLTGLRLAEESVPAEKRLTVIGDRESDLFALFVAPRRENTDVLVRVAHERATIGEEFKYLSEALREAPEIGGHYVDVPRQGSRSARRAKLRIYATSVVLKAPRHKTCDIADTPVRVWVVRISEVDPPEGVKGLEWALLSTAPVEDMESAVWTLRAYTARWVIEEFHHVLKSGCRVERMQLESADRLKPAIAVNAVVAWRVLYLAKHSRECPESDALTVSTPDEIAVLERWLKSRNEKPACIGTAKEFVRAVALLGGFMGRKGDGNPGTKVLWQGLRRLEDLLTGYKLATGQEM